MHGHVSEARKRELYQEAWVNVVASSAEGWCLSVMEAAVCRTPSAALAVGGLPESIVDGRTGILARNTGELAEKVGAVLADEALRDRLGGEAMRRAAEFTWDATARHTLAVIESQLRPALVPATPAPELTQTEVDARRQDEAALPRR